jgi:hypothetical protein
MDVIRTALEQGARLNTELIGKVQFGQLDVACSLRWMFEHRRREWGLIDLADIKLRDPKGYEDFVEKTAHCGRNADRPIWEGTTLTVEKSLVFAQPRRSDTVQHFIDKLELQPGPDSNSIRWKDYLTGGGERWANTRPVYLFGVGNTWIAPPPIPVYPMGYVRVGCPQHGYRITDVQLAFENGIKPPAGYAVPTDADGPFKNIELAVAIVKPWYQGLISKDIKVRATVRCQGT